MTDVNRVEEMVEVIERFGDFATGSDSEAAAEEWVMAGMSASDADAWLSAGCFWADRAQTLKEHGFTPEEVEGVDAGAMGYSTDGLAYQFANGNIGIQGVYDALRPFAVEEIEIEISTEGIGDLDEDLYQEVLDEVLEERFEDIKISLSVLRNVCGHSPKVWVEASNEPRAWTEQFGAWHAKVDAIKEDVFRALEDAFTIACERAS